MSSFCGQEIKVSPASRMSLVMFFSVILFIGSLKVSPLLLFYNLTGCKYVSGTTRHCVGDMIQQGSPLGLSAMCN